jgi:hypothetical protein
VKLLFVAWLVLPQFKGASFIYEKLVRDQLRKYRARHLRMGAAAADDDQKVHIAKVGNQDCFHVQTSLPSSVRANFYVPFFRTFLFAD